MFSFIRKHWGHLTFALASFFWAGCTDNAQPVYGVIQVPNESSSSVNDCPECEYGVPSLSSSSSEDFSSSSIPYMPVAEYGVWPDDSQLKTPEK